MDPVDPFVVPITMGMTPSTGGRLSPERAAALDGQLRALAAARARAAASCRTYLITGAHDGPR